MDAAATALSALPPVQDLCTLLFIFSPTAALPRVEIASDARCEAPGTLPSRGLLLAKSQRAHGSSHELPAPGMQLGAAGELPAQFCRFLGRRQQLPLLLSLGLSSANLARFRHSITFGRKRCPGFIWAGGGMVWPLPPCSVLC